MFQHLSCYSQRKVKNSESKSQQGKKSSTIKFCCYSQRKVKNSESKSQPAQVAKTTEESCYSQRKVKNSESKSQHPMATDFFGRVLLFTA